MRKLFLAIATLSILSQMSFAQITAEQIGKRIDVRIRDKFFTSYRFEDNEKYPFFFPVNAPVSGACITSMRNSLWPHHSSLFFGCDRVNDGNYWQEGLERGRIISIGARILKQGGDTVIIADECIWKRPDAESPIKDIRKITITSPNPDLYFLDFDIDMVMLIDVTISKTNHSLFSARVANDITVLQGGVMVNSEGEKGEKETFGQPSPWIDFYGFRKSGPEGIAILQHPTNKWYPSKWFTRDYGFISPTPMNWPDNDQFISLKKGEKVSLKYRVIVHKGTCEEANIKGLFEQYSK